MTVIQFFLI